LEKTDVWQGVRQERGQYKGGSKQKYGELSVKKKGHTRGVAGEGFLNSNSIFSKKRTSKGKGAQKKKEKEGKSGNILRAMTRRGSHTSME